MHVIQAIETRRAIKHYDPNHTMPQDEIDKIMAPRRVRQPVANESEETNSGITITCFNLNLTPLSPLRGQFEGTRYMGGDWFL